MLNLIDTKNLVTIENRSLVGRAREKLVARARSYLSAMGWCFEERKTTTLASALSCLHSDEMNIITLEAASGDHGRAIVASQAGDTAERRAERRRPRSKSDGSTPAGFVALAGRLSFTDRIRILHLFFASAVARCRAASVSRAAQATSRVRKRRTALMRSRTQQRVRITRRLLVRREHPYLARSFCVVRQLRPLSIFTNEYTSYEAVLLATRERLSRIRELRERSLERVGYSRPARRRSCAQRACVNAKTTT